MEAPTAGGSRRPSRAWRVRCLGTPGEALSLEEAAPVPPGPGEVRVDVEAIGLNFPDLLLCAGRYQERPALPFTPGYEAAGRVAEVGDGASVAPGENVVVVPELPGGAMQDSLTVPAAQVYPVPASMPATTAAVLHIASVTAHFALHRRGGLRPGETVVVTGAAGGVGSAAVQLARAAGARVVALATGAARAEACRRLGAEAVVDLAAGDPLGRLRAATGPGGADVAVDVVGGELTGLLRRAMAFEGRLVVVGFASSDIAELPANHVLLRNYSVVGLHLAAYRRHDPAALRAAHAEVVAAWEAGAVAPVVDTVLAMEQAPAALARLSGRDVVGRLVLRASAS